MSALNILIDGIFIASVCTDQFDLLTVNVSGTRADKNFADVSVSGGRYPDIAEPTHLMWVSELPLNSGQVVSVFLAENGSTSHDGKIIDELFPDQIGRDALEFKSRTEMFSELRLRPLVRDQFVFKYESKNGTDVAVKSLPEEHGFGFSVLWHFSDPHRAKVSLHS